MTIEERVEKVEEAKEHLKEAISLLEDAMQSHPLQSNTKAYLIDHLRIMASEDHGFCSRDLNCDSLIQRLQGNEDA